MILQQRLRPLNRRGIQNQEKNGTNILPVASQENGSLQAETGLISKLKSKSPYDDEENEEDLLDKEDYEEEEKEDQIDRISDEKEKGKSLNQKTECLSNRGPGIIRLKDD